MALCVHFRRQSIQSVANICNAAAYRYEWGELVILLAGLRGNKSTETANGVNIYFLLKLTGLQNEHSIIQIMKSW